MGPSLCSLKHAAPSSFLTHFQDVREREVEDLFFKYGRIRSVDLKVNNGVGWLGLSTVRLKLVR